MIKALNPFLLFFLLFVTQQVMAQRIPHHALVTQAEADSIRIDVMNRELKLSPAESRKFWPYFTRYTVELQNLNQNYFHKAALLKKNIDELNDSELNQSITDEFVFQQQKLDLKKKYNTLFRSVLPVRKLAHFYIAQEQFSRQLIRYRIKKGQTKPSN